MGTAATSEKKPPKAFDPLGRLRAFGLEEVRHAAFLLPNAYDDLRRPVDNFAHSSLIEGQTVLVYGALGGYRSIIGSGPERVVGTLRDGSGRVISFTFFGSVKQHQEALKEAGGSLYLFGELSSFRGQFNLSSPEIVPREWVGKIRPSYVSKPRVITPATSRDRVYSCLKAGAIPASVKWLEDTLGRSSDAILSFSKSEAPSLGALIKEAHLPVEPKAGYLAQASIERIAALWMANKAARADVEEARNASARKIGSIDHAMETVPFRLTEEQQAAARGMAAAFASGKTHALLSGDVGTGKTVVYGVVVAAAAEAGMRIAILLPNEPLAVQIHHELTTYWPQYRAKLVTGETSDKEDLTNCQLLIGTSALLFRDIGRRDLVVVDEQQKFARHQREQLMSGHSMLIEATATCVPRSQALIHFGGVDVFRLRSCHVKKTIKTKIWEEANKRELFAGIASTLKGGARVLVVYPKREQDDQGGAEEGAYEMPSVEEAFSLWDKLYPGRVRMAHGGMKDEEKISAIADLKEGRAEILLATSLVEVGITIPNLRRVVVVHAERFGLSTLHQIRGRVGRDGGEAFCDLYLPRRVKPESYDRLRVLVKTNDGFEVAVEDMHQRGFGDLSADSSKQTGADDTFLFGRGLSVAVLEQVMAELSVC